MPIVINTKKTSLGITFLEIEFDSLSKIYIFNILSTDINNRWRALLGYEKDMLNIGYPRIHILFSKILLNGIR